MYHFLVVMIIICMFLYHLFAIYFKSKVAKYILKPGTMVFIVVLAIYGSSLDTAFSMWVIAALTSSLIGDVFLMLKERWFVHGLISFLGAHLFYIAAFWGSFGQDITVQTSVITGVLLFFLACCFFLLLFPSVKKQGGTKLAVSVAFYIIIISVMVWSAILVGVGILIFASFLFYISDAVLAWNKFKYTFEGAEYMIMSTYFTAQILFALSIG